MSQSLLRALGEGRFALEGELDFVTVPEILNASQKILFADGAERLEIDLQSVRRANSAGLALLLEWLAQAHQRNLSLRFTNLPKELIQLAGLCDLDALLNQHDE